MDQHELEDLVDNVGKWHDTLDALWHATQIPMPAEFHVNALKQAISRMRDEMAQYISE